MASNCPQDGRKLIWQFWDSGLATAPLVIRVCHESWVKQNPGWVVRFLDNSNLGEFLDAGDLLSVDQYPSIQKRANHLRLLLLKKHGGVWADADVYCHQALDTWIKEAAPQGFFMFAKPAKHKPIANWMIVNLNPNKNGAVIRILEERYKEYFSKTRFRHHVKGNVIGIFLEKSLSRVLPDGFNLMATFFQSKFVVEILRWTPYFMFHYMYSQLLATNPEFRAAAKAANEISAKNSFAIRGVMRSGPETKAPYLTPESLVVSKLNYKMFTNDYVDYWKPILQEPFNLKLQTSPRKN